MYSIVKREWNGDNFSFYYHVNKSATMSVRRVSSKTSDWGFFLCELKIKQGKKVKLFLLLLFPLFVQIYLIIIIIFLLYTIWSVPLITRQVKWTMACDWKLKDEEIVHLVENERKKKIVWRGFSSGIGWNESNKWEFTFKQ